MSWAIRFEQVTKRYRGTREFHLRNDLARLCRTLLRGRARGDGAAAARLALDQVSFDVQQGESFALIGPNGAGKTTSLKMLTRISFPTSGRVRVRGRVGALIEVGAGLHPELTGRENIWLYGRIMGMSRDEIARRFDQIVDFSELSEVLDASVKTYSSGMQLRLGFSIASHLDPEIFVVDEALAVGDAGFQTKCVERMTQLLGEGKTLLFVSHNLAAVEAICQRGLFLLGGRVAAVDDVRPLLRQYLDWTEESQLRRKGAAAELRGRGLTVEHVGLHDASGRERYTFETGETITVRLHVRADHDIPNPRFTLGITDGRPGVLATCSMLERDGAFQLPAGRHVVTCRMGPLPLSSRTYELYLSVKESVGVANIVDWARAGAFRIELPREVEGVAGVTGSWQFGAVRVGHDWTVDGAPGTDPAADARVPLAPGTGRSV